MLSAEKLELFRRKIREGCAPVRGHKIIAAFLEDAQRAEYMAHTNYTVHHNWMDHHQGYYVHRDWLEHRDYS